MPNSYFSDNGFGKLAQLDPESGQGLGVYLSGEAQSIPHPSVRGLMRCPYVQQLSACWHLAVGGKAGI